MKDYISFQAITEMQRIYTNKMSFFVGTVIFLNLSIFIVANDNTLSTYMQVPAFANSVPQEDPLVMSFAAGFPECARYCHYNSNCNIFIFNTIHGMCNLYQNYNGSRMMTVPGTLFFATAIPVQQLSEECRRSKLGWEYYGTQNVTINGRKCQKWKDDTPHDHGFTSSLGNHNFCRNPDRETGGPWCYTIDPSVRWEYCDIHYCETPARECCLTTECDTYFGKVNVTSNGKICQRWDTQTPHFHSYTYLSEEGNYCRNPYNSGSSPWCFTSDSTQEWDYCTVPGC